MLSGKHVTKFIQSLQRTMCFNFFSLDKIYCSRSFTTYHILEFRLSHLDNPFHRRISTTAICTDRLRRHIETGSMYSSLRSFCRLLKVQSNLDRRTYTWCLLRPAGTGVNSHHCFFHTDSPLRTRSSSVTDKIYHRCLLTQICSVNYLLG
jgi:hypothetical protein